MIICIMSSFNKSLNALKTVPFAETGETVDALQFLQDLVSEYGDIVSYMSPYGMVYYLNHPDQVKSILNSENYQRGPLLQMTLGNGLLSSDGEYWKSQRRIAQPQFHAHCLPGFASIITKKTESMLNDWEQSGLSSEEPFDFSKQIRQLTMQIILESMFNVDIDLAEVEIWDEALQVIISDSAPFSLAQFNVPIKISRLRNSLLKKALGVIDEKVYDVIYCRRRMKDKPRDLLTKFIEGKEGAGGHMLSDLQIRDEIVTMLIAGHETIAITINWAVYLLSENPSYFNRVILELDEVLGNQVPAFEDLSQLPVLTAVLEETMRLYPPIWVAIRFTQKEDEIAGYRIPANASVMLSPYMTHRHPDFWENPDQFDPDRFLGERKGADHRFAYYPFLAGRHLCIGQSFAMMEGKLIFALLLQRFHIRMVSGGNPIEPMPGATLRQKGSIYVNADKREQVNHS